MFWEELYIRSLKRPNKMFQLFYKYLILNKKAIVPGLGVFSIERRPAKLDFANKVFIGPDLQINFKAQPLVEDSSLYAFISTEQKINVTEASVRYNDFANKLKNNLAEKRSVELPGIGVLTQNAEGKIFFRATNQLKNYFPPVVAERVIRENTEHHILVGDNTRTNTQMKEVFVDDVQERSHTKDYWWVFAIALGIIGIATIVYYYLHNGNLR